MSFYAGKYLIDGDTLEPMHTGAWFMPKAPKQHMAETSNVEELQVLPTDMNLVPTQIQFGACTWTDDEGFSADHDAFGTFYVGGTGFYVRQFDGIDFFTEFYVTSDSFTEFYSPVSSFYTRSFTPVDFFTEFYAAPDSFTEFYSPISSFYIRSFSAVNLWSEFYVPVC